MVFGVFSKVISGLPIQAVLRTIDLECNMLENDQKHHPWLVDRDASSIISFRRFLKTITLGKTLGHFNPLPPDHLEFYRETIVRLVKANELPSSAMEEFEHAFPLTT